MSAEHYDWLTAAARRSTRTADASQVVIDAVDGPRWTRACRVMNG
jgi:hypothetical protein